MKFVHTTMILHTIQIRFAQHSCSESMSSGSQMAEAMTVFRLKLENGFLMRVDNLGYLEPMLHEGQFQPNPHSRPSDGVHTQVETGKKKKTVSYSTQFRCFYYSHNFSFHKLIIFNIVKCIWHVNLIVTFV